MHKYRPDLLGDGPLILHNNARPHPGKVVTDLLSKYEWEVLPHVSYSPDISSPDFELFHKLTLWHTNFFGELGGTNRFIT
jgi:hypothetical protein